MTGFVTLAVGNEHYYKLAANLLQSYRLNGNSNAPFAIFADRENEYTVLFDKVILMDSPHLSYMDKLNIDSKLCGNTFLSHGMIGNLMFAIVIAIIEFPLIIIGMKYFSVLFGNFSETRSAKKS